MTTTPLKMRKLPPERSAKAKVVALMNGKGGCGKTTTAVSAGLDWVRSGKNVLFIDLDVQSNMSQRLGLPDESYRMKRIDQMFLNSPAASMAPIETDETRMKYSFTVKYRSTVSHKGVKEKGTIGLIAGSHVAVDAAYYAQRNFETMGNDPTIEVKRYKDLNAYFNATMDFYKQYYDYIIFDCAPALEGSILGTLAISACDDIICPVDGLEAALGVRKFIEWARNTTANMSKKPNITLVMVKYSPETDTADMKVVKDLPIKNMVYKALKDVLNGYMLNVGVQELKSLKRQVPGFSNRTQYADLADAIALHLETERPSLFEYFDNDKRAKLAMALTELERKYVPKTPTFRELQYTNKEAPVGQRSTSVDETVSEQV